MFRKFNLELDANEQSFFRNFSGSTSCKEYLYKQKIEENLKKFVDSKGELQGSEIIANWFPNIKADVFLSHSHADEKLVIGISKWLKEEFGLDSFIDSTVWGYADHLLEIIDAEYSGLDHRNFTYDQNNNYQRYDYSKRNRSTSHVHMMLSTALMNMIDHCECLIFVNTPNSFTPSNYLQNQGNTLSPWIYSEIAMANVLRENYPRNRDREIFDSANRELALESMKISYRLELMNLIPIKWRNIQGWADEWSLHKQKSSSSTRLGAMPQRCCPSEYYGHSLDLLYKMTEQNNGQ